MSKNITLPRKHIDYAAHALEHFNKDAPDPLVSEIIHHLRAALAAPKQEPVAWIRKEWSPDCGSYFDFCAEEEMGWRDRKEWTPLYATPPATHPGYVIGSHWLETAYSRICAGEAEADVLRDCGWERVDDAEALRRDAESLESLYHPATEILIEGLKKIGTEDAKRVLSAWDSGREIFDNRFLSRRNTR